MDIIEIDCVIATWLWAMGHYEEATTFLEQTAGLVLELHGVEQQLFGRNPSEVKPYHC